MSIKEMSRVWSDSAQKGNSLLLLLALADNANDAGYCFPGVEYLAHKTRMSERTVLRMIEELEQAGEIAVDHRRTKGNRYMIISGCDEAEKDRRIANLTDNSSPITANMSHITDTVVGKTPTTVNQPSRESSTTLVKFWETEIKTPVPGGIFLEKLAYRIEVHGLDKVRRCLLKANQYGKAHNLPYLDKIIAEDKPENGNGAKIDIRPVVTTTPASKRKDYTNVS